MTEVISYPLIISENLLRALLLTAVGGGERDMIALRLWFHSCAHINKRRRSRFVNDESDTK